MSGDAPDAGAAEIVGEATAVTAVTPSADQQRKDARGRIGNTAVQVGVPTAVVIIGSWLCALNKVDLDPGAGSDLPTTVSGAIITVLTFLMAYTMNRKGLQAEDDNTDG